MNFARSAADESRRQGQVRLSVATFTVLSLAIGILGAEEPAQPEKPSRSGKIVLFGSRGDDDPRTSRIQTMNPDGSDLTTLLELRDGSVGKGRIAPDGHRLAFGIRPAGSDHEEVWLLDPDGGRRKVADDGIVAAWSPDGARLACFRFDGGRYASFVVDLETGAETVLPIPETDLVDDWSPRGEVLTVVAGHPDRFFEHPEKGTYPLRQIDFIDLAGTHRSLLTTEPAHDNIWSRFSPDGSRVVHYRRHPENVPRIFEFAVVREGDGASPKDVLRFGDLDPERSIRPLSAPCWSPDGGTIAWPVTERKWEESKQRYEIVFIPLDGRAAWRLSLKPKGVTTWAAIDWR